MEIMTGMVRYYLGQVFSAYFGDHDLPPTTLDGYDFFLDALRMKLTRHNDLDSFRLALTHLLAHPEIEAEPLAGSNYPYDEEEIREVLRYMYTTLFPDAPPSPDAASAVRLVPGSLDDWWERTGHRPRSPDAENT